MGGSTSEVSLGSAADVSMVSLNQSMAEIVKAKSIDESVVLVKV